MQTNNRQNLICSYIQEKQTVRVSELISKFHVTDMTIRRDLDKLEETGLIVRFHGGARAAEGSTEFSFSTRTVENAEKKRQIAQRALERIPDHCTLYIDGSTTCNEIVLPSIYSCLLYTSATGSGSFSRGRPHTERMVALHVMVWISKAIVRAAIV